jgi:hypothetical protein
LYWYEIGATCLGLKNDTAVLGFLPGATAEAGREWMAGRVGGIRR